METREIWTENEDFRFIINDNSTEFLFQNIILNKKQTMKLQEKPKLNSQ
jgi:hypothetical protein